MKLLTKAQLARLPKLYGTEHIRYPKRWYVPNCFIQFRSGHGMSSNTTDKISAGGWW